MDGRSRASLAKMPPIGLGTFQLRGPDCAAVVVAALGMGYRLVDTAAAYANEAEVGEGLRQSGVPRNELFIVTKVRPADLADADFQRSAEQSLKALGLDAIDLLLIHWPNLGMRTADMIRPLNWAKATGLARNIGVSNFNARLLDEAWAATKEPLLTNQCEYHPYLSQEVLLDACRRHGMTFMAYSPLGKRAVLDEPVIHDIATRLGRSPAQIVLRWHIEQGVVPIPKAGSLVHLRQNIDVFGFTLGAGDMAAISALGAPEGRVVTSRHAPEWN